MLKTSVLSVHSTCGKHLWVASEDSSCKTESCEIEQEENLRKSPTPPSAGMSGAYTYIYSNRLLAKSSVVFRPSPLLFLSVGNVRNFTYVDHCVDM